MYVYIVSKNGSMVPCKLPSGNQWLRNLMNIGSQFGLPVGVLQKTPLLSGPYPHETRQNRTVLLAKIPQSYSQKARFTLHSISHAQHNPVFSMPSTKIYMHTVFVPLANNFKLHPNQFHPHSVNTGKLILFISSRQLQITLFPLQKHHSKLFSDVIKLIAQTHFMRGNIPVKRRRKCNIH